MHVLVHVVSQSFFIFCLMCSGNNIHYLNILPFRMCCVSVCGLMLVRVVFEMCVMTESAVFHDIELWLK